MLLAELLAVHTIQLITEWAYYYTAAAKAGKVCSKNKKFGPKYVCVLLFGHNGFPNELKHETSFSVQVTSA